MGCSSLHQTRTGQPRPPGTRASLPTRGRLHRTASSADESRSAGAIVAIDRAPSTSPTTSSTHSPPRPKLCSSLDGRTEVGGLATVAQEPPGEKQEHGNGCLIREARDTAFLLTGEEWEHGGRGGSELALRIVRDRDALARSATCEEGLDRLRRLARGRDPDCEGVRRGRRRAPCRGELGNGIDPTRAQECCGSHGGETGAPRPDEDHAARAGRALATSSARRSSRSTAPT
jgi:hypothetical protein